MDVLPQLYDCSGPKWLGFHVLALDTSNNYGDLGRQQITSTCDHWQLVLIVIICYSNPHL